MKIVEEPFQLTNQESTDNLTVADGTADQWTDIWDYQVPSGIGHVIRPEHTISMYLEDASAEVGNGDCQVRIEIRDSSEQDRRVIYGPAPYVSIKEFTDSRKIARFNVMEEVAVLERQHVVIVVKDNGAIDESDSYFTAEISRTRQTLT